MVFDVSIAASGAFRSAFACGFTRIITIAFMVLATAIEGYFVFTVWSYPTISASWLAMTSTFVVWLCDQRKRRKETMKEGKEETKSEKEILYSI